jgi:hypothetical protein
MENNHSKEKIYLISIFEEEKEIGKKDTKKDLFICEKVFLYQ